MEVAATFATGCDERVTGRLSVDGLRRVARRRRVHRHRHHGRSAAPNSESRDRTQWVTLIAVSLPGLAALAALLFTWMQVGQASKELHISEQGQITNRFNAAIGNMGSQSLDIRLGGIYALQRIMQDSARDHPTVVSVLAAFVQQHAGSSTTSLKETVDVGAFVHVPKPDVRAAIATLAERRTDRDSGTVVDLSKTDLRGLRLTYRASIQFPGVDLSETDLRWADLDGAYLRKANFLYANLENAYLRKVNLVGAHLAGANLAVVSLGGADLREADLTCASTLSDPETGESQPTDCVVLQYAILDGSDLRNAKMTHADLRNADLKGADLRGADLTRSDLTNADLTHADFRGANLTGVNLKGAKQTGALGIPRRG